MPDVFAGYHPRAVVLVQTLNRPIHRASLAGSIAGILAGGVVMYGLEAAPWPVAAVIAIAATVGFGLAVTLLILPTRVRLAFEAYMWLGAIDIDRLDERTGSRPPGNAPNVAAWLEANPVGPITREARVEMLLVIGRFDEARAELAALAALPTAATDLGRLEVAALRAFLDTVETGGYDAAALDAVLTTIPPGSPLALEAQGARAMAEARVRAVRGDPDPLGPLVSFRTVLGRRAAAVTFRRTWLPFARTLATFGVAVALTGYVLRLQL